MAISPPSRSLTALPSHEVRIDASKPLQAEPHTGHNRWHPDIPPILRVDPGDRVALETRDALDGQVTAGSTAEAVGKVNLNVVHPLTGPVYINGAEPGDLLEIKILEVEPASFGFTVQIPGFGFLRDQFPDPFIVRWRIADGAAESADLPGVRIHGAPFPGTIGLAPSRALMQAVTKRGKELRDRGGMVLPPDPTDAVAFASPHVHAKHGRQSPESWLSPPAGVCDLLGCRRPEDQRGGGRAQLRRVSRAPAGHFRVTEEPVGKITHYFPHIGVAAATMSE